MNFVLFVKKIRDVPMWPMSSSFSSWCQKVSSIQMKKFFDLEQGSLTRGPPDVFGRTRVHKFVPILRILYTPLTFKDKMMMMRKGLIEHKIMLAHSLKYAPQCLFNFNLRPAEHFSLIEWPSKQFEFETPDLPNNLGWDPWITQQWETIFLIIGKNVIARAVFWQGDVIATSKGSFIIIIIFIIAFLMSFRFNFQFGNDTQHWLKHC